MKKVIISVVGRDRPGIIATVARFLFDRNCNVENVSQTILQAQFSGIFIAAIPDGATADELEVSLADAIAHLGLFGHVRDLTAAEEGRLGVIMQATPLQSVMQVSDAGAVMPPKSTFFYPKLATGLVVTPLD